jgi:HAD superfamily hydrolase (TIGR01509 family)
MNYLFDMDGVLIDSKEAWFEATRELVQIDRERFDEEFWGEDMQEVMKKLDTDGRYFCDSVLSGYVDLMEPAGGAGELLSSLDGPMALITNTTAECTGMILKRFGLEKHFDSIVTADRVEKGKPDPEIIELAMKEIGASPEETVVIGDSSHDMEAGKAAGCFTIGIGASGDYSVESLGEILPVIDELKRRKVEK